MSKLLFNFFELLGGIVRTGLRVAIGPNKYLTLENQIFDQILFDIICSNICLTTFEKNLIFSNIFSYQIGSLI